MYKGNGDNVIRFVHVDDADVKTILIETSLSPFLDQWVHVYERIEFGAEGSVLIDVRRVADGQPLMTYAGRGVENWRAGSEFARPKWGVYRSLKSKEEFGLRDEVVLFDAFCLAKGTEDDCQRA